MKTLLLLLLLCGAAGADEISGWQPNPGGPVPLDGLPRGRPLALALIYYHCPDLCGLVLGNFLSAIRQSGLVAGQDYDLVVMSIDPADKPEDAAAAKAKHIARFPLPGAEAGWRFVTADPAVERSVGYLKQDLDHPVGIVFVTPQGRVSDYLLGLDYPPERVAAKFRAAARGEIAPSPVPQTRLFCLRYDPVTGRYSLAIFRFLQALAGLAACILAATLFVVFRRERRS